MKETSWQKGVWSLIFCTTIVFLFLKLIGAWDLDWKWVFSPIWLFLLGWGALYTLMLAVCNFIMKRIP